MMKTLHLILIGIIFMGLFSFFKKEKKTETINNSTSILGMILLEENDTFNVDDFIKELEKKWKLKIESQETGNEASVLKIGNYNIAVAVVPAKIPNEEVEKTAKFNYLWKDGEKETAEHKGHIILSIMNAGINPVQENLLFSKLASSIMNNSKSIGIYIGGRSLTLNKNFYQDNVENMSEQDLPLYNWIYFGLRNENGKHSVYTYGLVDFGKKEMEIINSKHSLEELNEMMFNMAHYVIAYDVNLKNGETIGISADQKLKITESQGKYLDGKTLKIEF